MREGRGGGEREGRRERKGGRGEGGEDKGNVILQL